MKLREVGQRRLLCFDLENRPLAYWYDGETTSQITAFGWKWSDERKVKTLLLQPDGRYVGDDGYEMGAEAAYRAFSCVMAEAGLVYGHNIRKHDLPIFNAHLFRAELPPLKPVLTSDTCRDIPRRGGMSVSLENLASLYGLPGKKYTMSQPMWEKANRLTDDGVALARKRVASDVLLQERLRNKLIALGILKPPRMWFS